MKKAIPWKSMLSTSVSIIVVIGILVLLMTISNTSELVLAGREVITPIAFTPAQSFPDEKVKAGENDRFVLWADLSQAQISLYDKASHQTYTSSPEGLDELDIKNNAKFRLKSLLSFEYSDRDSNAFNQQNSFAGSVNKGNYTAQVMENGVRFDFYFEGEGFLIPLEITLNEAGIRASVPLQDIREESDRVYLTTVTVLPNFGCGSPSEDGYLLLPDGCGAIADFSLRDFTYTQRVYGQDLAVVKSTSERIEETARLPVYGIKRGDSAFLSVISSGAARACVDAAAPKAASPYATAAARFIYREIATVDVSQKTFESTQVNVFEETPCAIDSFAVDYRICDSADYTAMAKSYRQYLLDAGAKRVSAPQGAFYLDLIGGAMCHQSVMGIPVNKVLPITGYADAEEIFGQLQEEGITDLTANYRYWYKDGSQSSLTVDGKAESALGGEGKLESLAKRCEANGVRLYLDLNLTDMRKDRWGYMRQYDSAQSVRREPVIQYDYLHSTFQKETDGNLCYLLSPASLSNAAEAAARSLSRYGIAGCSANSLAGKIYSDMGKRQIDRGQSEVIWQDALASLSEQSSLLLSAANGYGLPFADTVTDVPLYTSGYRMETAEVPFYPLVMHGLAYLSTGDINGYADPDTALLKALEGGLGLKYALGARNVARLSETTISAYSYIAAGRWIPHAGESYRAFQAYLTAVSDQELVRHELLTEDVRYSEFANGLGVYVNYADRDYTDGALTVPAKGYVSVGW